MVQLKKSLQTTFCFLFICVLVNFVNSKKYHKMNTAESILTNNDIESNVNANNNEFDLRLLRNSLASDPDALSQLRYQLLARQFAGLGNNAGDEGVAGDDFDRFLTPSKRQQQLRFRQCYFNPISCFRK